MGQKRGPQSGGAVSKGETGAQQQPVFVDDDELEWHTASWARDDDRRPTTEGTGKGSRARGKGGRKKAPMSEGDRILERISKGDIKLDAPAWEGGGRVDRDNRSNATGKGKAGWSPRGR